MKNVKDQIYAALCKVADNVTDVYPANWAQFPVIQYTEEDNSVIEHTDNKEDKAKDTVLISGITRAHLKQQCRWIKKSQHLV